MEIIFLIVGGIFLVIGVGIRRAAGQATQGWTASKGEIIGHVTANANGRTESRATHYHAILKFSHLGDQWFVKDPMGSITPLHSVGDKFSLRLSPASPCQVSVESRSLIWFANTFVLIGAVAVAVFFLTFRWNWFSLLMALPILLPLARTIIKKNGIGFVQAIIESRHLISQALFPDAMTREQVDRLPFVDRPLVQKLVARQRLVTRMAGFFLMAAGLAGLWGGETWLRKRQALLEIAKPASGKILRFQMNHGSKSTTYSPIVGFRQPASQTTIEFKHPIASSHPSYREGDAVGVLYNPSNPKDAIIDAGSQLNLLGPWLALLGSVLALVLGLKTVRT